MSGTKVRPRPPARGVGRERRAASSAARAEYMARIHRVMDHVERHLDERLSLEDLARVACFSPYHFHRVFTACTGEPLHRFILRLRLEKAASRLVQSPRTSVTAVALDCGFGSSAAFARAFRAEFGTTASAWRRMSKEGEAVGKAREETHGPDRYGAAEAAARGAGGATGRRPVTTRPKPVPSKPADAVRIEDIPPFTVAYVRHVGPYAGDSALFERLFERLCRWAGPRGLLGPGTRLLTLYHDNPEITAGDKLRISVCATVPEGTRAEGEVGTMRVDGGRYAVASFALDPSEYGAAWDWLMGTWFPASGFQPDDRLCFEVYLNDPGKDPRHLHRVEFWEPVRPL